MPQPRPAATLAALALVAGLTAALPATPARADTGPALTVDPATDQHPISQDIYGMNFAPESLAAELRLPVRRWGGNATTLYNYALDETNRGSDWYFENAPGPAPDPSKLPDGSETDQFVEQDLRTGTDTILTLPLIGWTPKARDYGCAFSIAKYGPQQASDQQWRPDCGNGVKPDGTMVTGNDPHDVATEIGPQYVTDWLGHLTSKYGTAATGGVKFYNLDNEADLWEYTHRAVHPVGPGYDEMRDSTYAIAGALKAADPDAKTLGPVGWGWNSLTLSGLDQQTCSTQGGSCWSNPPDRAAHGGTPFGAWYLAQLAAYERAHGVRLLDYYDNHWYPQGANVTSEADDPATQALRLRETRNLWDPTYTDESWINQPTMLIPRMRQTIDQNYPGTKLAITEYNWGGLTHVDGALAEADVLGIFGHEGVDLATLWAPPAATDPGANAFRMYLNYDGQGGHFGDVSVHAASADQGQLAVYAAKRSSDGALTLMVVNKTTGDLTSPVSVAGLPGTRAAQVWRYGQADTSAIHHDADQQVVDGQFTATFPAYSVTELVVPPLGLAAKYRNVDTNPADNRIRPAFQLVNNGSSPLALSRVTLRYWFSHDGASRLTAGCDAATTGCRNVTRKVVAVSGDPDADEYLEVGFTTAAGTLAPGAATEVRATVTAARGCFAETGDWSWAPAAAGYADNPRVAVAVDGTRIAGSAP
jgi:hypothetical protein